LGAWTCPEKDSSFTTSKREGRLDCKIQGFAALGDVGLFRLGQVSVSCRVRWDNSEEPKLVYELLCSDHKAN
jgi:hypothetical protein